MADNNTNCLDGNSSKRANPEFLKARNRVSFLFYAPFVFFSILLAVIAIVWNYKIEYLIEINTYMKDSGIVDFIQKYIMPAWKTQEIQLIKKGYREIRILHSASTLFTFLYTFFVFMAILFKYKMYYQDFCTINMVKKRHTKMYTFIVNPMLAIISVLGCIMFLVVEKFNFKNTWKGLTPTLEGLFKNNFSIFLLLYFTFIIILFFFPVSFQHGKRNTQHDELL